MVKLPDYHDLGPGPGPTFTPPTAVITPQNTAAIPNAAERLGETTQRVASDTQDVLNVAAVNDAMSNDYQPKVRELAANYYSLTGKDAMNAAPKFAEDIAAARDAAASKLIGQAQTIFQTRALGIEDRELYSSSKHAGEQMKVYAKQSNDAAIDNHVTDFSQTVLSDPAAAHDELFLALKQDEFFQNSIGAPESVIRMRQDDIKQIFSKAQAGAVQKHLTSLPGDEQISLLKSISHGSPISGAPSNAPTSQNDIIDTVMNHLEGDQLVQNDNGHGPSKYGVVGKNNGLTPEEVASLSPDQAKQIYKDNYWKPAGIDNLPDNMKMIAFDTAVQFGVGAAKGMIAKADGDPQKLLDIRSEKYRDIIASDPARYGDSASSWQNRTATLSNMIGTKTEPGQSIPSPKLFGIDIDPSTVPKLLEMAESTKAREVRLQKDANETAQLQTQSDFVSKWSSNQLKPEDVMSSNLAPLGEGSKKWWLDQIAKGPEHVNPGDPAVVKQRGVIENMKLDDPQGFIKMDMSTMAGKLPASDITSLQSDQMKMRKGDQSIESQNKQAKDVVESVADMLPTDWKNPKTDSIEKDASAFKGNLINAVKDAQAAGGKPLGREEVRKIASDMMANVKVVGRFYDSTYQAYQIPEGTNPLTVYRGFPQNIYIPEAFRSGFGRAWQSKFGKPPTESDVRAGFLKAGQ